MSEVVEKPPNENKSESTIRYRMDHRRYWLIACVTISGILLSFSVFRILRHQEEALYQEHFRNRSVDRIKSITSQFESGTSMMRTFATYFQHTGEDATNNFRAVATSLLRDNVAVQALSWNPRVTPDEIEAHIAAAKVKYLDYNVRQMGPEGVIQPWSKNIGLVSDRRDLYVVALIEPIGPNRSALGFDIASEPKRREALTRACESGDPAATARIRLVQETGSQFGTLVIAPVYTVDHIAEETPSPRRISGVVVGVYRIGDAVTAAMTNLDPVGIDIHLFDLSSPPDEQLLFFHSSRTRETPIEGNPRIETLSRGIHESTEFSFGGRRWAIYCTPTDQYPDALRTWLPHTSLAVGVFISLLIATYIYSEGRLTSRIRHEMSVRANAERREAEQQLTLAHISRLNTMGEMVTGIAHEISQPLSAISNYASAAENVVKGSKVDFEAPVEEWLNQIGSQAVRCGDIVRQVRRFVTKDDQEFHDVNLHDVVSDSIDLITSDKHQIPHKLKTHLPDTDLFVLGSHVQLQQVLINLLRNAYDSTNDTPDPSVVVSLTRLGDKARLTVEDNGPGIDREKLAQVFDPFFTTKADGLGMGLAISKSIVEAHHGKLWIDKPLGNGARFCIELPLATRKI